MPGPLKRSVHRDTAVDDKIGELFPNIMFSKRADGLRAGKRKRSRGPSPPINNRSRLDDSDHGDKDTNDGMIFGAALPKRDGLMLT